MSEPTVDFRYVNEILLAAFDVAVSRSCVEPEQLIAAWPVARHDRMDWNLNALIALPDTEREVVTSIAKWASDVLSCNGDRVLPIQAKI